MNFYKGVVVGGLKHYLLKGEVWELRGYNNVEEFQECELGGAYKFRMRKGCATIVFCHKCPHRLLLST